MCHSHSGNQNNSIILKRKKNWCTKHDELTRMTTAIRQRLPSMIKVAFQNESCILKKPSPCHAKSISWLWIGSSMMWLLDSASNATYCAALWRGCRHQRPRVPNGRYQSYWMTRGSLCGQRVFIIMCRTGGFRQHSLWQRQQILYHVFISTLDLEILATSAAGSDPLIMNQTLYYNLLIRFRGVKSQISHWLHWVFYECMCEWLNGVKTDLIHSISSNLLRWNNSLYSVSAVHRPGSRSGCNEFRLEIELFQIIFIFKFHWHWSIFRFCLSIKRMGRLKQNESSAFLC